ncbi:MULTISPECIES: hypothetical protein [unclassified Microcoleus]|uniref:hypothetical protein n=1 Tax=unclassified Microcoleus TaxID=2642155 RepID=UPI001D30B2A2|nr:MULTISPECIES: hypothetical protein [unclassified Microcoleus]MCC3443428.1 hypothetical protein [Microcoleus sp. PH2017_03_ELD_O_A]MCC3549382.1 hypothetical protein [Microcoleus sp. PH2017_24_DOB_U_A]
MSVVSCQLLVVRSGVAYEATRTLVFLSWEGRIGELRIGELRIVDFFGFIITNYQLPITNYQLPITNNQ